MGSRIFDQIKFRAAVGTAGARPSFSAQYEALTIGTGGSITANTLGNKDLRPENTLETEYGVDAELFHKYGLNITYARDITTDQLLLVPASVSSGFSNQWRNAGTMDGRTWEVSLNVPVITKRSLVWTSRFNWDQNRAYITSLDVPEYNNSNVRLRRRRAVRQRLGPQVRHAVLASSRAISSRAAASAKSGSRTTRATSSGSARATRTRTV